MTRLFALGLVTAALALAPSASRAAGDFSDPTCQQATAPVRAYVEKSKNSATTLDEAVAAAQRVVDAYDLCASEHLSRGETEDFHYAHLLQAQYDYVVGGWQHLAGNDGLARIALQASIKLTQDIIDWHPPSQYAYSSNDVNVGSGSVHNAGAVGFSKYREDAIHVRDAAVKSMSLLAAPAAPTPAPTGK